MTADAPTPVRLGPSDAGEVLTLQRAAYVTEARAHDDLSLPPLTEELPAVREELGRASVTAWGVRDDRGRLVAAVRVEVRGDVARVNRLVVAPDRQGAGLGSGLLAFAEGRLGDAVTTVALFTGEHSAGNLRLYRRAGYVETHRTGAGTYELVHLTKARTSFSA
ncbi:MULTISPECIES: N-acetyltransferase [unclassified Pseudonocardia]|uniref:GNAT family N-acetyltransferase n=1 Tax=unclassified Pseudonocardia TaxID=2619320 RepID=UPI001CF64A1A|nr:GNAT family N-acetyltransferase [Pseudonocardia sp. ICBG601]